MILSKYKIIKPIEIIECMMFDLR